jgi:hypothetical protein
MKEKARYQIFSSVKNCILEIVFTGELSGNDVNQLMDDVLGIIKPNNTGKVLADIRNAEGRFGYAETYFRVRQFPPDKPMAKVAILDIPKNAQYGSFLEITAHNAGFSWKYFTDKDEAINWLKSI